MGGKCQNSSGMKGLNMDNDFCLSCTKAPICCILFLQAYKDLEIPTELTYLWRYLKNAYESDAFKESCPADREIITQYVEKASCKAKIPARRSQLMGEERTFSTPEVGNGVLE